MRVDYHPAVEAELREIRRYYEHQAKSDTLVVCDPSRAIASAPNSQIQFR